MTRDPTMIESDFQAYRRTSPDYTVPLRFVELIERETGRWPPQLDHDSIVERLVGIRESGPAYRGGLADLTRLLRGVEGMTSAQIATTVVAAMTWTQDHHGYGFVAAQLQIVAMNLKHLD